MMNLSQLTRSFIARDPTLVPYPEMRADVPYSSFDDGGVEIEVGEFLFSFVNMIKPLNVLETGLYSAISAMYIASALKANNRGHLDTIELEKKHIVRATARLTKLELMEYITIYHASSLKFTPCVQYDLLFLDSEPYLKFSEINRYWDNLANGGFILIHDLNWHLGERQSPWEDFTVTLGKKIRSHQLSVIGFQTPRTMVLMQKWHDSMGHYQLLADRRSRG